jgi:DNA-directed RNA polymerase subunit H (RpoH/RPB5)
MNLEFNLEFNDDEKKTEIFNTIIKIMIKRKKLNESNNTSNDIKKYYDILIKNLKVDDEYETFIELNNNTILRIKLLYLEKISKINDIEEFLLQNTNDHKIIVVNKISMTAKIYNGINKLLLNNPDLNEIELFKDSELIFNILEANSVPEHILLTKEENKKFIIDYDINEKNKFRELPKIFDIDIICRYLGAKYGDIIKIININEVSGYGIIYRIVIKGKLFE